MSPEPIQLSRETLQQTVSEFCAEIQPECNSDDLCFLMCAALQPCLEMMGYPCFINQGNFSLSKDFVSRIENDERRTLLQDQDCTVNHYWIELNDGTLVDPTADQLSRLYNLPALPLYYVGEKPDWYPSNS
jgi:hypothetical protein